MAKPVLVQQDLIKVPSLNNPGSEYIAFGAKLDGLYIKLKDELEQRLITINDLINKADDTDVQALEELITSISQHPVRSATINKYGHLILTLYDYSTLDAGLVKGSDGVGIVSTKYDPITGKITFKFSDTSSYTTDSLKGEGLKTLTITNISELDTMSLEQGIYLVRGAVYGQLTVVDMVSEEVSYFGELSDFNCTKEEIFYTGELSTFVCAYKPMINNLITAHLDEANNIYAAAQHPVDSVVNVQLTFTIEGASADTRDVVIYPGNTESLRYSTGPLMEYYVSQASSVSDSSYNYIFTSSF
jgi:hypothetical protein